jgi:hypothetical protein
MGTAVPRREMDHQLSRDPLGAGLELPSIQKGERAAAFAIGMRKLAIENSAAVPEANETRLENSLRCGDQCLAVGEELFGSTSKFLKVGFGELPPELGIGGTNGNGTRRIPAWTRPRIPRLANVRAGWVDDS